MPRLPSRRAWRAGLAAVLIIAAVAFGAFRCASPRYRPALQPGERYGIDISRHQGTIDWDAVSRDGVSFAYLKATEGGDWTDPSFERNWREANDAGLAVGAYHFFRTCTDGAAQARHVLDVVPAQPPEAGATERVARGLPIAIDVESGGVCENVTDHSTVKREFDEFVRIVEAERGPLVFYVLPGFEYLLSGGSGLDGGGNTMMWRRLFLVRPRNPWAIWQATWFVRIEGISGPVDLNVMSADMVKTTL